MFLLVCSCCMSWCTVVQAGSSSMRPWTRLSVQLSRWYSVLATAVRTQIDSTLTPVRLSDSTAHRGRPVTLTPIQLTVHGSGICRSPYHAHARTLHSTQPTAQTVLSLFKPAARRLSLPNSLNRPSSGQTAHPCSLPASPSHSRLLLVADGLCQREAYSVAAPVRLVGPASSARSLADEGSVPGSTHCAVRSVPLPLSTRPLLSRTAG